MGQNRVIFATLDGNVTTFILVSKVITNIIVTFYLEKGILGKNWVIFATLDGNFIAFTLVSKVITHTIVTFYLKKGYFGEKLGNFCDTGW